MATVQSNRTDARKLKHASVELMLIPETEWDNSTHVIKKAFDHNDIEGFSDFLNLQDSDFTNLSYPDDDYETTGIVHPLPLAWAKKCITVAKFYHHASAEKKGPVNMLTMAVTTYNLFRISVMDPTTPIIPWQVLLKKDSAAKELQDEMTTWKKNVKPNKTDFPEFKDDAHWPRFEKNFKETAEAQNLEHLLDPTFTITNAELDAMQSKWMYKVFKDKLLAPKAKSIVLDNEATKNVRVIWKAVSDHYGQSISTELRCNQLSTYITSSRLASMNWRGTITNFVLHFKEQGRQFNELSPEPFTDTQLRRFMQAALLGTPLENVWNTHVSAVKSTGTNTYFSYEEYITALLQQAATLDAGNTYTRNPRGPRREVNVHDFGDEQTDYEIHIHDAETDISDLMVYQGITSPNNHQPRRVMMDKNSWMTLSREARQLWDKIPDKDRQILVNSKPSVTNGSPGARTPNPGNQRQPFGSTTRRQVSNHESAVQEEPKDSEPSDGEEGLHVSTHEHKPVHKDDTKHFVPQDLLTANTPNQVHQADIRSVLSQPSKKSVAFQSNSHQVDLMSFSDDGTIIRDPLYRDAYSHQWVTDDGEYESEDEQGTPLTFEQLIAQAETEDYQHGKLDFGEVELDEVYDSGLSDFSQLLSDTTTLDAHVDDEYEYEGDNYMSPPQTKAISFGQPKPDNYLAPAKAKASTVKVKGILKSPGFIRKKKPHSVEEANLASLIGTTTHAGMPATVSQPASQQDVSGLTVRDSSSSESTAQSFMNQFGAEAYKEELDNLGQVHTPPKMMKGIFSNVEKPTRTLDRLPLPAKGPEPDLEQLPSLEGTKDPEIDLQFAVMPSSESPYASVELEEGYEPIAGMLSPPTMMLEEEFDKLKIQPDASSVEWSASTVTQPEAKQHPIEAAKYNFDPLVEPTEAIKTLDDFETVPFKKKKKPHRKKKATGLCSFLSPTAYQQKGSSSSSSSESSMSGKQTTKPSNYYDALNNDKEGPDFRKAGSA